MGFWRNSARNANVLPMGGTEQESYHTSSNNKRAYTPRNHRDDRFMVGIQWYTVVHFVTPEHPDLHTQGVESFWLRLKGMLRRRQGVKRRVLREHLRKFTWWEETPTEQHFIALLLLLAIQNKEFVKKKMVVCKVGLRSRCLRDNVLLVI